MPAFLVASHFVVSKKEISTLQTSQEDAIIVGVMRNCASIPDRIKSIRSKMGLSQAALAKRMGMTPSQLCKIELGHNGLSGASIRRLSEALGVTIAELMGEPAAGRGGVCDEAPVRREDGDLVKVREGDLPREMLSEVVRVVREREKGAMAVMAGAEGLSQSSVQILFPYGVDEESAELLARDMRNSLGIGCAPIVDLEVVLEMRGVSIVLHPFPKQFQSATFFDLKTHKLDIVLNAANTSERNVYRLAYELGTAAAFAMSGFSAIRDEGVVHRFLRRFTAAFLMPEETVRMDVAQSGIAPDRWTFDLLTMMKSHFAVSAEAYALRLESLGLIVPELRTELRDKLRAYYRRHPKSMEPQPKDRSHLAIRLEMLGCSK